MKMIKKPSPISVKFETVFKELTEIKGRVGWFDSSKYPDQNATPVAYVAAIHEFGSPSNGIPARPYMRPTEAAEYPNWSKIMADGSKACINGKLTAQVVMTGVVKQAQDDIGKTIANVLTPPLSPVTILLRKWKKEGRTITRTTVGQAVAALNSNNPPSLDGVSQKPLHDTGYLATSLQSEVAKE